MNDNTLADELSALLLADAGILALIPRIAPAQAAAVLEPPSLEISGEYTPSGRDGSFRRGLLTLELKSRLAGEGADEAHADRFDALWTFLLGAPGATPAITAANREAAKVVLSEALAARGKVQLIQYGPAPQSTIESGAEDKDFRTVLSLLVAWRILPPV